MKVSKDLRSRLEFRAKYPLDSRVIKGDIAAILFPDTETDDFDEEAEEQESPAEE